ncbi:MAG: response regulator transcription factor [Spirochaetota bacterium]
MRVPSLILVEDNKKLSQALIQGLEHTEKVKVMAHYTSGEKALENLQDSPDVYLMDVSLAGTLNGIETIVEIRKEFPRKPVVIYSIQDKDSYFRQFRHSGILSHFAYVKKSNYLLPAMILPLVSDAIFGKSFIDPEIADRVEEVIQADHSSPLNLLEPNELKVALLLGNGYSNEQIARIMGYKDKRTISRINGQIYIVWDLKENKEDEKIARTRAALIVRENKLLHWEKDGRAFYEKKGEWLEWQ